MASVDSRTSYNPRLARPGPLGTRVKMIKTVEGDAYEYQGVIYRIRTEDGRTGWVPQKWCKAVMK